MLNVEKIVEEVSSRTRLILSVECLKYVDLSIKTQRRRQAYWASCAFNYVVEGQWLWYTTI